MSATITINFQSGKAASNMVFVALTGCSVAPGLNGGVNVQMGSALTNISVSSGQVGIATATQALFNGSMQILIGWTEGATPEVTLNNLSNGSGPATVTWPTASGPEIQALTPGNPMPLTGIVSS